jgi:hypothetical protein
MEKLAILDAAGLRTFGLLTGAILVVLFGVSLPWLLEHRFPIWPWIVALPLWLLGICAPTALQPVYQVWMRFGMALGVVNATIILGLVFYFLLTPIGLLLRWLGNDAMNRAGHDSSSYRVLSRAPTSKQMERPF